LQAGGKGEASVRRTDRMRVEAVGDEDNRLFVYDGRAMTIMDRTKKVYSTVDAPPEIDAALDPAIQAFNLRAPLADLIYTKSYEYLTEGVIFGFHASLQKVAGVPCHHLAFKERHRLADLDRRRPDPIAPEVPHH
jgi:hypothetical protein